ncbi:polysaccharide deacetylase family protein [Streptomyces sp. NPDC058914]|uniref:polysaccharide deacetylase family protein n=1 Tax=Streptomyces sp. NPDC058914 TaxID=3346671 RepID=UPI00368930A0
MALPANITTVTVFGRYIDFTGTPMQGTVTFTPSQKYVTDPTADVLIFSAPLVATLDSNGAFSIEIPATDDPDVTPQGFTWQVVETFNRKAGRSFSIAVPEDTPDPGIDLVTVAPVLPADQVSYIVTSIDGETGTVDLTGKYAPLDEDGKIPVENIPSISAGVTSVNGASGVVSLGADDVGALPVTGGTMQGPLALHEEPTDPMEASTKAYVDSAVSGLLSASGGTVTGDLEVSGRLTSGGFRAPFIAPSYRRPMWANGTVVTNFQNGHGWTVGTGTGAASSNANDTSDFIKGTQATRVTTVGNAGQSQIRKTAMPSFDLTAKAIRLVLKVDDVTHLDRIAFYVGTSGFTNFFQWDVHTHSTTTTQNWVSSGEWVTITLDWAAVTSASGSFSLSSTKVPSTTTGFTDMQVAVYDKGTGAVTWRLQSIDIIDATSATFPNGVVSLSFDDSYSSVYEHARPLFDAKGWRGTCYHIAELVGSSASYMTLSQIRKLQDYAGWEQGGHSYLAASHTNRMTSLTAAQADTDLARMRAWLISNGLTGDTYAWPGGEYQATTDGVSLESIASRYFSAARSITQVPEHSSPPMPYRLRTITGVNDGTGLGGATVAVLTAAGGLLDRCASGGSWLNLCLHRVVTGTPTDAGQISLTGLQTLLDAIETRGITVLPVGDVLRYYS